MRRWFRSVAMAGAIVSVSAAGWAAPAPLGPVMVASPDGALVVSIAGTGAPSAATWRYRLERQDATPATELLGWSPLGLTRQDAAFTSLHLVSASTPRPLTVSYTMPFGKRRSVTRTATSRVLHFQSPSGQPVDFEVRVFDDGLAFRYVFPNTSATPHTVTERSDGLHRSAWLARVAPAAVAGRQVHAHVRGHVL